MLLSTGTYRAGAFLQAAERLGLSVVVGTDRPQVLAAAAPEANLTLDFSAPAAAAAVIASFAAARPLRAVLAADDDGVVLAALAAGELGLRHSAAAAVRTARDKHRSRLALAREGLLSPWFSLLPIDADPSGAAARLDYPCVVKPLSLAGSRGVIRADDPDQLVKAFHRVRGIVLGSPGLERGRLETSLLVEGYIPGVEVAVEGLLARGALEVLAIFDKPDPLEGPFFEETIYVTPSRLAPAVQSAVSESVARATRALGLSEGPVHAEARVNDEGVWILEIAPRSIGGLCSRTLRFEPRPRAAAPGPRAAAPESGMQPPHGDGHGVAGPASLEELILRQALGLETGFFRREAAAAGVMMIPIPRAGILRGVGGRDEALAVPGIEDLRLTIPAGQPVVPPPEGSRYLGFLFARGARPETVERALREAHGKLAFEIAP